MAKKDQSIELSFQVDSDEAEQAINSITRTSVEANRLLIRMNSIASKKFKDSQIGAAKLTQELNAALKEVGATNLENSKRAIQFQIKTQKLTQQIRKDQQSLSSVEDGRKVGKEQIEAAERLKKNLGKLKSEVNKYNKQMSAFTDANKAFAEYERQLRAGAESKANDIGGEEGDKYLEERNRLIDEELSKVKEQLDIMENIEDAQERQTKLEEIRLKYEKASNQQKQQNQTREATKVLKDSGKGFLAGMADKMGGGNLLSKVGAAKDLHDKLKGVTAAAETLSKLGAIGGNLGKVFTILTNSAKMLSGALGGFLFALIAIVIEADAAQKEMNRRLLKGVGSAGIGENDLLKVGASANAMAIRQNAAVGDNLRLTGEEIQNTMNILMQSGMSIKNLTGGYESLTKATEVAAVAARNFGLEIEEGGKLVGDYFAQYGKGVDSLQDTFATLNHDIKNSSMTATNFLSIIQSTSAQFSLFLDQTKTFSKLIVDLGGKGAFSQKQLEKMFSTIAEFGAKGLDEGIQRMALMGPSLIKEARKELVKVDKQIKDFIAGKSNLSEAEFTQLTQRREALRATARGGISGGGAVSEGMSITAQLAAFLSEPIAPEMPENLTTRESLTNAVYGKNSAEKLKILGAKVNRSPEEMRTLLLALRGMSDQTGKSISEVLSSDEFQKNFVDQVEAAEDAKKIASQSVTKLSGLGEMTNILLVGIQNLLDWIGGLVARISGGKTPPKKSAEETFKDNQKRLQEQAELLKKSAKDSLTQSPMTGKRSEAAGDIKNTVAYKGLSPDEQKAYEQKIEAQKAQQDRDRFNSLKGIAPPTVPAGAPILPNVPQTTPKYLENATPATASTAAQQKPDIQINAVLQLKDNQAIETVVKKVNYQEAAKETR